MTLQLPLSSVLFRQLLFVKELRLFSLIISSLITFILLSTLLLMLEAVSIFNESSTILAVTSREHILTQYILRDSLALTSLEEDGYRPELSNALHEWQQKHDALLQGNAQLGVRPLHNQQLLTTLHQTNPSYNTIRKMAQSLLQQRQPAVMHVEATTILRLSEDYCNVLEKIILFEQANNAFSLQFTVICPIISGAVIFVILLLTYLFTYRPLFKKLLTNITEADFAQNYSPPPSHIAVTPLDPQRFRISSSVKLY